MRVGAFVLRVGQKRISARLGDDECQLEADCGSETNSNGELTLEAGERGALRGDDVTANAKMGGAAGQLGMTARPSQIAMSILYEGVGHTTVNHPIASGLTTQAAQQPNMTQRSLTSSRLVAAVSPYHIHLTTIR